MEPKKRTISFTVKAVRNGYIITLDYGTLVATSSKQVAQVFTDSVVDMFEDMAESEQVKIDIEANGI